MIFGNYKTSNLRIDNIFETLIEQYLQKYEPKIN